MKPLLFIIDPWDSLKVYKDSSLAMMRCAMAQGFRVEVSLAHRLSSPSQGPISAFTHEVLSAGTIQGDPIKIHPEGAIRALNNYHAVVMRKDPPFDMKYVSALWLLRRATQQGATVVNHPEAMLNHNEKASILEFPEFTPPTLIASQPEDILDFLTTHHDIIVKPLNGMGGAGVFRLRANDPNNNSIIEMLLQSEASIMAQTFLPAISEGDKRVFVLGGMVQPYTLARIPKTGETRGNLAAGGNGVAMPITTAERLIAESLAPRLMARGLILVGLDMIGERLTEINVTSPTCMVEIETQTGYSIAEQAFTAIQKTPPNSLIF